MISILQLTTRTLGLAVAIALTLCGTSRAQCPADDATAFNDSCNSPWPGTLGATVTGLSVQDVKEDWWSYPVPTGDKVTVDMAILGGADVDLELFLDTGFTYANVCTTLLDSSSSTTPSESVTYHNTTPGQLVVKLRVYLISGTCADYELTAIAVAGGGPCTQLLDDSEEENDDCTSATIPSTNPVHNLNVSRTDQDWYLYTVNPGEILQVTAFHSAANGDLDLEVISVNDCFDSLASALSTSDDETVFWNNTTGAVQTVAVHVFLWNGNNDECNNDYSLGSSVSLDPCFSEIDDSFEPNDTCQMATPGPLAASDLFVYVGDEDFYSYTLQIDERLEAVANHQAVDGRVFMQLFSAPSCGSFLASSQAVPQGTTLSYHNTTGAPQAVQLRAYVPSLGGQLPSACNRYELAVTIQPDNPCSDFLDDVLEDNDACVTASSLSPGLLTDLLARKELDDEDWYSIDVHAGATVTVTATFDNDQGNIDMELFDGCNSVLLDAATGPGDVEEMSWTNDTGSTLSVKWRVWLWFFDTSGSECNTYDMEVEIENGVPGMLVPYCFGDGSDTPCPCGNNSPAGYAGGCANATGDGAILVATGSPTVGADTLNMNLSSAAPNSFALLFSGLNPLPDIGACIGCGIAAFDGLRCAGGSLLRHGVRATDINGDAGNGWGALGGPAGGLIGFNGFAVGQTRYFSAFYRDDLAQVCGSGQNSSNAIQVTFN